MKKEQHDGIKRSVLPIGFQEYLDSAREVALDPARRKPLLGDGVFYATTLSTLEAHLLDRTIAELKQEIATSVRFRGNVSALLYNLPLDASVIHFSEALVDTTTRRRPFKDIVTPNGRVEIKRTRLDGVFLRIIHIPQEYGEDIERQLVGEAHRREIPWYLISTS